ncbi:MAG TPA: hypothetical protein VJW23_19230 [Propionibacteriaceae bacterium]|nr:hypothetical protein [Propionibacteriaceae bacterium]
MDRQYDPTQAVVCLAARASAIALAARRYDERLPQFLGEAE